MERVEQDIILKSLWFTCASLSQTFERTIKSKENILYHAWRIFTGKLGELFFVRWLLKNQLITLEEYKSYEDTALSVFWGKTNVDKFDLNIMGYLIDIKTLPEFTHKYLIIPEDQFNNQPKDIYICIRLKHNFISNELKAQLFFKTCFEIYDILITKTDIKDYNFSAEILGFAERNSSYFNYSKQDKICPEKPCYRVDINHLKSLEELLRTTFTLQ